MAYVRDAPWRPLSILVLWLEVGGRVVQRLELRSCIGTGGSWNGQVKAGCCEGD